MDAGTTRAGMTLKVLLPHCVHIECDEVQSVVVQTSEGSFGLLPRRLDCAAVLVPGILYYTRFNEGERYIAVDAGVMVKIGDAINVSVRRAIGGSDLAHLRELIVQQFIDLDAQERVMRSELAKLESGFIRRYLEYQRG